MIGTEIREKESLQSERKIIKVVGIELVDSGFEGTAWHCSQNSR
jgi:hypothetical protein